MPAKTVKMTAFQATKSRVGSLDIKRRYLNTEKKRIVAAASGSAIVGAILGVIVTSAIKS
jgi:hypothetical protein